MTEPMERDTFLQKLAGVEGPPERVPPPDRTDCLHRSSTIDTVDRPCCGRVERFRCTARQQVVEATRCRSCDDLYASPLPHLTLCLNSHNEGPDLPQTILSAEAAYSGEFSCVIVADGTTDGSADGLPDYCTVIHNSTRVGCGQAKDQMTSPPRETVYFHEDAHCRHLRGSLDEMARMAMQHDAIIVPGVAPLRCDPDMQPEPDAPFKGGSTCYGGKIRITERGCKIGPAWKPKEATAVRNATWWAVFMYGRATLERLGGWNAYPGQWGSQEIGLALRAWFADIPIIAMRDVVVGHRYQAWWKSEAGRAYQARVGRRGNKYSTRRHATQANHRYAHQLVFDEATLDRYWRGAWKESQTADKMLADSRLEEQRAHYQEHCKRRTDEAFIEAFELNKPDTASMPATIGSPLAANVTAVLLNYKRPKSLQRCVDRLHELGISNVWAWCQNNATPPAGADRIFRDSENASTWARWCVAPLVETDWILFIDDDCLLKQAGLDALLTARENGAGTYGLIGARFEWPYDRYNTRTFYKSHQIERLEPVDMLWPKGMLIHRDVAQRAFGHAQLWQHMRRAVGSTSGDDLVAAVAQSLAGEGPLWVVPSNGKGYRELREETKGAALSKQPGRLKRKRGTVPQFRALGWRPSALDAIYRDRIEGMQRLGAKARQHPDEMKAAFDLIAQRRPSFLVEVGSAKGGSLYAYAGGCKPGAMIIAIDDGKRVNSRRRLKRVIAELKAEGYDAHWLRGKSTDPALIAQAQTLLADRMPDGVLHIDGGHKYATARADYEAYRPMVSVKGLTLLHDIAARKTGLPRLWGELTERGETSGEIIKGIFDWGTAAPGIPFEMRKAEPIGIGIVEGDANAR